MSIEFVDDDAVSTNRAKYPAMLDAIKERQLKTKTLRGKWAKLAEFEIEQTARDMASRFTKKYPEFEFTSNKDVDRTIVYARLKEDA